MFYIFTRCSVDWVGCSSCRQHNGRLGQPAFIFWVNAFLCLNLVRGLVVALKTRQMRALDMLHFQVNPWSSLKRSWCNHSICPASCSSQVGEDAYTDSTIWLCPAWSCLESCCCAWWRCSIRLSPTRWSLTMEQRPKSCHCTPSGPCRCLGPYGHLW